MPVSRRALEAPESVKRRPSEPEIGHPRISLAEPAAIGEINLYSWHRNGQFGGARAPLRVSVYASDGTAEGFNADDPASPGYVLLARINTLRPGGVNAQGGQHGASVFSAQCRSASEG